MKTEVKVALIGGAVTIIVAIIAGIFGMIEHGKQPSPTSQAIPTAEQQQTKPAVNNGNQIGGVHAGGSVTIKQTTIGK